MKICVIGLGYIGFPTACMMARSGHEVIGVDVNPEILRKLRAGSMHIVNEDGLAEMARDVLSSGALQISERPVCADVFLIAVPTPFRIAVSSAVLQSAATAASPTTHMSNNVGESRLAELSHVFQAAIDIAPYLKKGNLVVLESTVPPGTTDGPLKKILEVHGGIEVGTDISLAHAPERVLPGNIVAELIHNNRIVGGVDELSTQRAISLYRSFVEGEVVGTDCTTAELVKLMENTFRDVNVALANEFALVCECVGVNVWEAISLANRHPRVNILRPGPGVGGHCIAVDPYFIVESAPDETNLIALARQINSDMPYHVVHLVNQAAQEVSLSGLKMRRIVCLGVSYKPNVGDDRESPSYEVIDLLRREGFEVVVHDPYVSRFQGDLGELLAGADLIVMLTDHAVYRQMLTPSLAKSRMNQLRIVDTRGSFGDDWDALGFTVVRLGVGEKTKI